MLASLGGQHALSLVTVPLALAVLLVRILHGDLFIHQILAVHVGDGGVGGLEVAKGDEAVAFGQVIIVAGDLRSLAQQPSRHMADGSTIPWARWPSSRSA